MLRVHLPEIVPNCCWTVPVFFCATATNLVGKQRRRSGSQLPFGRLARCLGFAFDSVLISIFFTFGNWNIWFYFNFAYRFFFGLMILDSLNGFCCIFFVLFNANPFTPGVFSGNCCCPASRRIVQNQIAFVCISSESNIRIPDWLQSGEFYCDCFMTFLKFGAGNLRILGHIHVSLCVTRLYLRNLQLTRALFHHRRSFFFF